MERYSIAKFEECEKKEWDNFVENNDECWFWHTSAFIKAWPYGENVSFCIKKTSTGEIMLIQMLMFSKGARYKKWIGIPYQKNHCPNVFSSIGGFACKNGLLPKEKSRLEHFYIEQMDKMIEQYCVGSFSYCILATLSKRFWPGNCPLINPMIYYGYRNRISQSYIIDLANDEESIFGAYSQTTRNLISKCMKDESLSIVEAESTEKDLDLYYGLHVETYNRTGANPHPKSYFEQIFFQIMPMGYCHILFCYRNEELVAAHNMLIYKDVGMYWTGASATDRGEGENRLLMHKQIQYAKSIGCKWFEVGEAFPNVRNGKLKGLNDYKKSFGGIIHPLFAGEYDIKNCC